MAVSKRFEPYSIMALTFSAEIKFLLLSFPLGFLCNFQVQIVLDATVGSVGTEIIWTKRSERVIMRFEAEKGKMVKNSKRKPSFQQLFDLWDFRVSRFLWFLTTMYCLVKCFWQKNWQISEDPQGYGNMH